MTKIPQKYKEGGEVWALLPGANPHDSYKGQADFAETMVAAPCRCRVVRVSKTHFFMNKDGGKEFAYTVEVVGADDIKRLLALGFFKQEAKFDIAEWDLFDTESGPVSKALDGLLKEAAKYNEAIVRFCQMLGQSAGRAAAEAKAAASGRVVVEKPKT